MHLEILVEEPSAEAALANLLQKMLRHGVSHRIHAFRGKTDLLSQLSNRLRGYKKWLPASWRVIVLVDRDDDDCAALKSKLDHIAEGAGLATKSKPLRGGQFQVLNRLAIEELEAWFFGDIPALNRAYPKVPLTLHKRHGYRDPDAIAGGTWEALERILQRAGYYKGHMPKIEVAQSVSQFMDPDRNASHSFNVFRDGLLACLS